MACIKWCQPSGVSGLILASKWRCWCNTLKISCDFEYCLFTFVSYQMWWLEFKPTGWRFAARCSNDCAMGVSSYITLKHPHCLPGSVGSHRSQPTEFKSQHGHVWRVFPISLHLITVGTPLAHLPYFVHKSGHKTSNII